MNCRILYSTQSGRAKACARRVARIIASSSSSNSNIQLRNGNGTTFDDDIQQQTINGTIQEWVVSLSNDNNTNQLTTTTTTTTTTTDPTQTLLLLFISTTGDGEHTDTIQQTWKQLLQKSLSSTLFANITIGLFCLGDRCYGDEYCIAGRKLGTRLLQLGAKLFCTIGYGDDNTPNGGIFCDLDIWIYNTLIPSIEKQYQYQKQLQLDNRPTLETETIASTTTTTTTTPLTFSDIQQTSTNGTTLNSSKDDIIGIPPYNVKLVSSSSVSSNDLEESMNDFFKSISPVTAYRYDDRITEASSSSSSSSTITPANGSQVMKTKNIKVLPLKGLVTENRMLIQSTESTSTLPTTSAQTIGQDTRHIRIEIGNDHHAEKAILNNLVNGNNNDHTTTNVSSIKNIIDTLPYRAGDVAVVIPVNSEYEVNRFISVLPKSIQDIVDNTIEIQYNTNNPKTSVSDNNNNNTNTNTNFYPGVCYQYWPKICTIRSLLTYCVNIMSLPEREDLRTLGYYCCIQHERYVEQSTMLYSLCETSSSKLYIDYILREKRTWADVLYDFDSLQHNNTTLSIEVLLSLLVPIRPRDYSIASSPIEYYFQQQQQDTSSCIQSASAPPVAPPPPRFVVELCVGIVRESTPLGRSYLGFCTNYLANLSACQTTSVSSSSSSIVRLWIRPGSFHGLNVEQQIAEVAMTNTIHNDGSILPSSPSVETTMSHNYFSGPILCIGAGTGIAPLRALIRERYSIMTCQVKNDKILSHESSNTDSNQTHDGTTSTLLPIPEYDNVLLFGCRNKAIDYYYNDEWNMMERNGQLGVLTAFSRDVTTTYNSSKTYVQHVLQNTNDEYDNKFIVEFLTKRNGCIYIAGNPNMAKAIKDILIITLTDAMDNNEQYAKQYLNQLQRTGRIAIEAWS